MVQCNEKLARDPESFRKAVGCYAGSVESIAKADKKAFHDNYCPALSKTLQANQCPYLH